MGRWFLNFSFDGRARRSHTWGNYFAWLGILIALCVLLGYGGASHSTGVSIVAGLLLFAAACASFMDHMAMSFRRAHDTGKSGWIWILLLIPFINLLALYWLLIEDSQQGPNKYGPAVKAFYTPPSGALVT